MQFIRHELYRAFIFAPMLFLLCIIDAGLSYFFEYFNEYKILCSYILSITIALISLLLCNLGAACALTLELEENCSHRLADANMSIDYIVSFYKHLFFH